MLQAEAEWEVAYEIADVTRMDLDNLKSPVTWLKPFFIGKGTSNGALRQRETKTDE